MILVLGCGGKSTGSGAIGDTDADTDYSPL